MPRHRAQEFRKFLDEVESNVPAGLDIHVVMDNASSHKTQVIRDWFAKRPHWHTALHADIVVVDRSGRNASSRAAGRKADKARRAQSVKDLIAAIKAFLAQQNADPKPLRWTKSADDILASIERFCRRTLDLQAKAG